ncbi:MAG: alpha-1,2-fucosyltransferase [Saprospiraceae bacterium]
MIYIRLKGGMGNQMFQYAFGLRMARALGVELSLDLSILLDRARGKDFVYRNYDLDIFNLESQFLLSPKWMSWLHAPRSSRWSSFVRRQLANGKNYIKEPHFHVAEQLLTAPQDETIYDGWWQSGKYFEEIEEEIRKAFSFVYPIEEDSLSLLQEIQNTSSVCLNVRRTDFVKNANLNTTDLSYFLRATEQMAEKVSHPHFFIFSDDVAWCAENFKLPFPTTLVGHDHKGIKFGNYMQLMIACQHFIIPNSSFAWWAVWLNQQPNKVVIAPKNWFNDAQYDTSDLVPKNWIRM